MIIGDNIMKEWMTIKDLSDYLQMSESMIRSFIRQKRIPFYDNHGLLRFHRIEIDEWMKTPESENNQDCIWSKSREDQI